MKKCLSILIVAAILAGCSACVKAAPKAPPSCIVSITDGTSVETNWYDGDAPVDSDTLPVIKVGDSDTISFSVSWEADSLTVVEDYYNYRSEDAGIIVHHKEHTLDKNENGLFTLDIHRRNDIRDEQAVYAIVSKNGILAFKVSLPLARVEGTFEIDKLKYMPVFINVTAEYFLEMNAGTLIKIGEDSFSADTSAALASPVESVHYSNINFTKEALGDTIDVFGKELHMIDLSPYTKKDVYKVMINYEDTGYRIYYLDDEVWFGHFSWYGTNKDAWWADYIFSLKPYTSPE